MSTKFPVKGFGFGQHRVHDRREFFRDDRTSDRFTFAALQSLEFILDVDEVLNGANRRMMKRDLEISIAIT